jgi:NAD+ synthase (glutamine-hydrolysing)
MNDDTTTLRVALAQINPIVGGLKDNVSKILFQAARATEFGAQLLICPELSITGYPPEDLVLKPSFVRSNVEALKSLALRTGTMPLLVGFVEPDGERLYDSAALVQQGIVVAVYRKIQLPNYAVFDEKRYFEPGSHGLVLAADGVRIGVTICEDLWIRNGPQTFEVQQGGANLIVNLSASPYHRGKWRERRELISRRARECGAPIVYANMVGGQDDLIFDGHSLVADNTGAILAQGRSFMEELVVVDLPLQSPHPPFGEENNSLRLATFSLPPYPERKPIVPPAVASPGSEEEEVYKALVLGTHDYVRKNGFTDVLVGLSGGIDSALVASVAVDALGPDHVHCLFMPSIYTSRESTEDAAEIAGNFEIDLTTISIDETFASYKRMLNPSFRGVAEDITEENIQARIRGNILMALSNKFGYLVLATGNKSELACGYATLYGDMAGGFAVIKDVLKTMVFRLVEYRNAQSATAWLPERLLTKAPSAELKPGQRDTDSLPPYELLDPILQAYVEQNLSLDEIVQRGFPRDSVRRVLRLIDKAEYKRRQSPPGIRITSKAFGKDRRVPITNRFWEEDTL